METRLTAEQFEEHVRRLRVWEEEGFGPVAIVSEVEDNPGQSITNAATRIAAQVYQLLERPESGLVLIEHYGRLSYENQYDLEDTFDLVTFMGPGRFDTPTWRRMNRLEVVVLLGGTLTP